MTTLVMIMVLTFVTILVVEFGNRVKLPWPALMVVVGLAIAWVPGSHLNIPSDLVLPMLLPPLLFSAAERTSWQMFRQKWRSILVFAVALTVVTVAAVASVSWILYPAIGLPAALILGATVSPPDPVAVESVSKSLPIPRRILSTLQTEGLFNDAVALVIFEVALSALVTGDSINVRAVLGDFLVGMILAVIVGFALAFVVRNVVKLSDSAVASAAATLVLPYAAYLVADELHASGVLAVVVAALEYRRTESADDVEERLVRTSFWEVAELILTGIAFGVIGEGLQGVMDDYGAAVWPMVWRGLGIALTVMVVRVLYLLILRYWVRRSKQLAAPRNLREVVVMSWGGMRGLITLALAASLPATIDSSGTYFAHRADIVVAASMVLVVTLLFCGLTFPFVMRNVGLKDEAALERRQEEELVRAAGKQAFLAVSAIDDLPDAVSERMDTLIEQIESGLLERSVQEDIDEDIATRRANREAVNQVYMVAMSSARESIVAARNRAGVDPVIVDRILQRLDMQTALLKKK